ncbi:MAG: transport protein TonB [Lentisphaerae bacterium ADurb.BinA184]|nr:MAG: transport protein TonB [Lentisphaerae bacterium ADurb.BinA184]
MPAFEAAGDFALDFVPAAGPLAAAPVPAAPPPTAPAPAPVAAPASEPPVEVSLLDSPPVPLSQPTPAYPFNARRQSIEGYADIVFTVDESGRVTEAVAQASSPPGIFEGAATAAVRRWRFEPGQRNRRPVSFRMQVRIRFRLED